MYTLCSIELVKLFSFRATNKDINFWPKIYLILYPFHVDLTTQIAQEATSDVNEVKISIEKLVYLLQNDLCDLVTFKVLKLVSNIEIFVNF